MLASGLMCVGVQSGCWHALHVQHLFQENRAVDSFVLDCVTTGTQGWCRHGVTPNDHDHVQQAASCPVAMVAQPARSDPGRC